MHGKVHENEAHESLALLSDTQRGEEKAGGESRRNTRNTNKQQGEKEDEEEEEEEKEGENR